MGWDPDGPGATAGDTAKLHEEIMQLRAALKQFVAACETAPPTSLMNEIGMAVKVAKAALSYSNGERT